MDIRLFKLLVLIGGEVLLVVLHFLMKKLLPVTHFHLVSLQAARDMMVLLPLFLLMPEGNWIWLVEDNYRTRKISLRSKASKHLYLSSLYWLGLGLPFFIVTSAFIVEDSRFGAPLSYVFGGSAMLLGVYAAWRNARNVKKFDTLFAVAWDRRGSFIEIFVGISVSRRMRMFYPFWAILLIVGVIAASALVVAPYHRMAGTPAVDREKFIVARTFFNFFLTFSTFIVTMYVAFQLFFQRGVEAWVRDRKERHHHTRHMGKKQEEEEGEES